MAWQQLLMMNLCVSGFHLSGEVGSGAARPPSVLAQQQQPFVSEPDRIFKVSVSFDR
jgi:hypothetical protein